MATFEVASRQEEEENEEEDDQEDDEDDEDEVEGPNPYIQLGYIDQKVNNLFLNKNWKEWDGGCIGGKPIWLHRKSIPHAEELRCSHCNLQMLFLLQIYCPLDYPDSAFHRCLYLFGCRKNECIQKGSLRCLRSQLSKDNEFYPFEPTTNENNYTTLTNDNIPVCTICGCFGSYRCGKCHQEFYCSREHQKLDWNLHKLSCKNNQENSSISSTTPTLQLHNKHLYPSYSLIIEEENLTENLEENKTSTILQEEKNISSHEGEDGTLAIDNQASLSDSLYLKFLTRISLGGNDQVLRYYCREAAIQDGTTTLTTATISSNNSNHLSQYPLPISSIGYVSLDKIPNCEICGGKRSFEFQVMPQLLHYLQVDANTRLGTVNDSSTLPEDVFRNMTHEDIDWGSLDIFTCMNSCPPSSSNHYLPEYVWRQPPPLEKIMIPPPVTDTSTREG